MSQQYIEIHGARVNNLKNINVKIPKNKLVVLTGISGSGKSSLAFDTIYAEGQRRYVESLSSYAKQFIGLMDKPDVDQVDGLSPAIAIDQRSTASNPRSTVGTLTEIYDYLRLLFARVGRVHCPSCYKEIFQQTQSQIIDQIIKLGASKKVSVFILAPLLQIKKEGLIKTLEEITHAGFSLVRMDGKICPISQVINIPLDDLMDVRLDAVIAHIDIPSSDNRKTWLKDDLIKSVATALEVGTGHVIVLREDKNIDYEFSQYFYCSECHVSIPALEPRNFSFNSPAGACTKCLGLGTRLEVDTDLVIPNKKLTIAQGAIKPWARNFFNQNWYWEILKSVAKANNFSLDVPVNLLTEDARKIILYGSGEKKYISEDEKETVFEGVVNLLEKKYHETSSDYLRKEIGQYMRVSTCPACKGKRLRQQSLSVTVANRNIAEITAFDVDSCIEFFKSLEGEKRFLNSREEKISHLILKEVIARLLHLQNVGLGYVSLDRSASSLSGGEAQRVRLATQISMSLSGVIYILDEPSIGLHQKDNQKLINTLMHLRDLGNTVIVVEHDAMMMEAADIIIDIGPGAGDAGGRIVAQGRVSQIKKAQDSLTGKYLSGILKIPTPKHYRKGNGKYLEVVNASEFNLKEITVRIPLGKLVCFTGVSGSGKSTLLIDIIVKALSVKFYHSKDLPGKHQEISGTEFIDKIISIDQSPIGRTPRSNPATYTGVFTSIRDVFTELPEAKIRGYDAGKFSFNARGGRCESCAGEGMVKIEMQFLPDVYVWCEDCNGKRYMPEVLEIHYNEKNIADILNMTVVEAMKFFSRHPLIYEKLKTLDDVGLGYIKLGQSATTLSGGEAQRVKLATELSRRATGKTLYILDEPTTGLHFQDIKRLLQVLNQLVDKGNSIFIIEHNLDVIKCADWIIDLGPEGGDKGGEVVAEGTPQGIIKEKNSYTGQYLKKVL